MIKYKSSTLIVLVVLLFGIFISGCYTIIHPPFTVKERVTKVIVKDKESDLNYEDEKYLENSDRESENETHIYYYHDYYTYYDPFYDWWSYWNPFRYRYYHQPNRFYPYSGFGFRYYSWDLPWDLGFYWSDPWCYPHMSIRFNFFNYDRFVYWDYYYPWYRAYHPFAYGGYFPYSYYGYQYGYYPYYGYNYNYAYYKDSGPMIPYKKRDFGRRQDYRVSNDNINRIKRSGLTKTSSAGDAKDLSKRNDGKNADTYSGRRTRRDEYSGTRSVRSGNIGRSSGSGSSGSVNRGSSGSSGSSSTGGRRTRRYNSQIENNSSNNKVILNNQTIKNNSDYNQKPNINRNTIRERVEIINRAVGSYLNRTFSTSSKGVLKKEPSNYSRYESNNSRLIREFTNQRRYSPLGGSEFRSNFSRGYSPSSGGSSSKQGASNTNNRSSSSSSSRREKR